MVVRVVQHGNLASWQRLKNGVHFGSPSFQTSKTRHKNLFVLLQRENSSEECTFPQVIPLFASTPSERFWKFWFQTFWGRKMVKRTTLVHTSTYVQRSTKQTAKLSISSSVGYQCKRTYFVQFCSTTTLREIHCFNDSLMYPQSCACSSGNRDLEFLDAFQDSKMSSEKLHHEHDWE